jgi:hypothetical protein
MHRGVVRKVQVGDELQYRVRLAPKAGKTSVPGIWQALDNGAMAPQREAQSAERKAQSGSGTGPLRPRLALSSSAARVREALRTERGRFCLALSPVAAVFLLAGWLLLAGQASYTKPLSISGVLVISILAGIFPVLLLLSSRRRGDLVPAGTLRFLGHPLVAGGLYLLFLGDLLLHGLWIWKHPVERACALLATGLVVGATVQIRRRGGFSLQTAVHLMALPGRGDRAVFQVVAAGRPAPAEVTLSYPDAEETTTAAAGDVPLFSRLRAATFAWPRAGATELRVWAHRMTDDGESESLPALLTIHSGGRVTRVDAKLAGSPIQSSLHGEECRVEVRMEEPPAS